MKIAFISSEIHPFSKTGGLADVSESLPVALKKKGVNIIAITPLYKTIDIKKFNILSTNISFNIFINFKWEHVKIFSCLHKGIKIFFIYNETYFNITDFYKEENSDIRFGLFAYSVIELCKKLNFQPDIFHINDWQPSLIPVLLKTNYINDHFYANTKTLLTIHNLAYQGFFPKETLHKLGIPESIFHFKGIEFYNQVNFLKGGIIFSDYLNTVSPTYAKEIITYEAGRGLDGVLREKGDKLSGILNGIDYDEWNPATDKNLFANYDINNIENKVVNKTSLQKFLKLNVGEKIPLFSFIGRLTEQKGIYLIKEILKDFEYINVQLIILGTGESNIFYKAMEKKVSFNFMFNEELARKIYAASDFFLMPSLFEPCGISQMISMRYGTIPIVREVGGLKDSVKNNVTGFVFKNFNKKDFSESILDALKLFSNKSEFIKMQKKCMNEDFSWHKSSELYIELYKKIISKEENV